MNIIMNVIVNKLVVIMFGVSDNVLINIIDKIGVTFEQVFYIFTSAQSKLALLDLILLVIGIIGIILWGVISYKYITYKHKKAYIAKCNYYHRTIEKSTFISRICCNGSDIKPFLIFCVVYR